MQIKPMDKGIKYMIIASIISAFSGLSVKILTQNDINSMEAVLFRNLFGLVIILYLIFKNPPKSTGGAKILLLTRGFTGLLGIIAFFYTIGSLPLGTAITLNKTSPIFGAIFSFLLVNEKLKKHQILALLVGFVGVAFITRIDTVINADMLYGLLGGVLAGISYTSIRTLKKHYDTKEIVLSFSAFSFIGALILLLIAPYINQTWGYNMPIWHMPTGIMWLWVVVLGISGTASQYFMTKAYEYTKTGIVGTIAYANIPFAIFLGVMLGDSLPTFTTLIGIFLIIIGGILVSRK
jgi:drug/metabolite transporter (DMT)-like permease